MPSLKQSLLQQDLGYLRTVGQFWQINIPDISLAAAAEIVTERILNKTDLIEKLSEGPADVIPAIKRLIASQGAIPSTAFHNLFGEIRIMGESRRAREKPWEKPISVTEWLWYHGIVQQGMLNRPVRNKNEIAEYVYLPDEIYAILSSVYPTKNKPEKKQELIIRPAAPREVVYTRIGDDSVLDLSCIILAAVRTGNPIEAISSVYGKNRINFLIEILKEIGILDQERMPILENAQDFLQMNRHAAILKLIKAWQISDRIDDLRNTPDLFVDDLAVYSSKRIRMMMISLFRQVPPDAWWSFDGFVASIRQSAPDFLRSQGENSSWLIRNQQWTDQFNNWENVEGEFLRYLISCPLFWFGIVDIAVDADRGNDPDGKISAFRISRIGNQLLEEMQDEIPEKVLYAPNRELETPKISIDGRIIVSNRTPRIFRYQAARFCEWEKIEKNRWVFRVTPASLQKAKELGLSVKSFVGMLRRIAGKAVSENLLLAIDRWDLTNTQATMFHATLLTVSNPDWIVTLLNSKETAKWIEQQLNMNTVIIKPKGEEIVRRALIELGTLVDKRD